jgi:hypothetical protein
MKYQWLKFKYNIRKMNDKLLRLFSVVFSGFTVTIWKNKNNGETKYQLMFWRDSSGVCFKYCKEYGFGSCGETIAPKNRPYYWVIPILKTN